MPRSIASSAALLAAIMAAVGLDSILSALTTWPPEDNAIDSVPVTSVMCMIVLLNEENIWQRPHLIGLLSRIGLEGMGLGAGRAVEAGLAGAGLGAELAIGAGAGRDAGLAFGAGAGAGLGAGAFLGSTSAFGASFGTGFSSAIFTLPSSQQPLS